MSEPHPPTARDHAYPRLLDWLRYLCAFLLYMYGLSKLAHMQFSLPADLAKRPIGSLTGYELTWFYYGYSRVYASILGLIQVAGATLLLFRKTSFLGAALMFPVMANILLIDLFILVNDYGPEFNAAVILISLTTILWYQRTTLISLFWNDQPSEASETRKRHFAIRAAILIFVSAAICVGVYTRMNHS